MTRDTKDLHLTRFQYHPMDFYMMSEKHLSETILKVYGTKESEELTLLKENREAFRAGYVKLEQAYTEMIELQKHMTDEEIEDGIGEELNELIDKFCTEIAFLHRSTGSMYDHITLRDKLR